MIIELNRAIRPTLTFGRIALDGVFECYTLEDVVRPYPNKVKKETAIWEGEYWVTIDFSPKYMRMMPHVLDVPLFSGIRIHSGNTIFDTEGCILVGTQIAGNTIINSKVAYQKFFPKLEAAVNAAPDRRVKFLVHNG